MCGYLNCDKLMKCCSDCKSMKQNKKRTKREFMIETDHHVGEILGTLDKENISENELQTINGSGSKKRITKSY